MVARTIQESFPNVEIFVPTENRTKFDLIIDNRDSILIELELQSGAFFQDLLVHDKLACVVLTCVILDWTNSDVNPSSKFEKLWNSKITSDNAFLKNLSLIIIHYPVLLGPNIDKPKIDFSKFSQFNNSEMNLKAKSSRSQIACVDVRDVVRIMIRAHKRLNSKCGTVSNLICCRGICLPSELSKQNEHKLESQTQPQLKQRMSKQPITSEPFFEFVPIMNTKEYL